MSRKKSKPSVPSTPGPFAKAADRVLRPPIRTPVRVTDALPVGKLRGGKAEFLVVDDGSSDFDPSTLSGFNPDDLSKPELVDPKSMADERALIDRLRKKLLRLADDEPATAIPENMHGPVPLGIERILTASPDFEVTEEEIHDAVRDATDSEDPDPHWEEATWQMIRSSCAFMAQELLRGPPELPYNGKFFISEHHQEWDRLVYEHKRLCVLAARDHGKTYFFDFAYPIWQILRQPWGSGFIFSATQPQAERILGDIKYEIETNPKLQWLLPSRKDRWSSTSIRMSNGHRIFARGFGTKVRGAHPDWIVCDDVLNDETMYSELVRQKQIDYFYTAITNMIVPTGQIVVVGTPFHKSDLYASLHENPEYHFQKYQAQDVEGKALWPDRYNKELLERRKVEIGTIRYTREFLCEPVSDDMSLFPQYLFRGEPTEQMMFTLGMSKDFWDRLGVQIFVGVDFAMSSSVQADYTVVWVMGTDKFGNRWIVDIIRKKGLPYQEQLSLINEVGRKYEPALIFLESNQMQRIFGDELIRLTDLPIKEFVTGVQKNSLDKGVPSLRVLLENKKFRIPRGDKHSVEQTELWIDEMRSFTWSEGKLQSVGGHDDTVMGCWICDQAIRHGGFEFTFGDEYQTPTPQEMADLLRELTGEEPKKEGGNGKDHPADLVGEKESVPRWMPGSNWL